MEFKILGGVLSWFRLELFLLRESMEGLETGITAAIAKMDDELGTLEPHRASEWTGDDSPDIQVEDREPSEVEVRYAELDDARWSRERHLSIVRSAIFLATYAAFEQCLDGLANQWREARGLELKPSDLRDRGIDRSKAYLSKVVKMRFPSDTAEWGQICHLRAIRNQIAHEGPRLSGDPGPRLRAAFAEYPGIYSEKGQQISLTADFLNEVFSTLRTFTLTLTERSTAFSEQRPELLP